MSLLEKYEIPKKESEIQELLTQLEEHRRYNNDVLAKAEHKIARYTRDVQDTKQKKVALREKITETEKSLRVLQSELLPLDDAQRQNESKLSQYIDTKERTTTRLQHIKEMESKLQDALRAKKPSNPSKRFAADQFSDDDM